MLVLILPMSFIYFFDKKVIVGARDINSTEAKVLVLDVADPNLIPITT